MATAPDQLKRELQRLQRCMDFVSQHPALSRAKPDRAGRMLAEIYQQLGQAWEFLALQCSHRHGFRTARDGTKTCRVCGTIRGTKERWLLLRAGRKRIGRFVAPQSKTTFSSRKVATIVNDAIDFHGATVSVEVFNRHASRFLGRRKWTIAEDRIVRVVDRGIECRFDTYMVKLRLVPRGPKGSRPPYGAFLGEIPKKLLRKFPVLLECDQRDRLVGLTVFKPRRKNEVRATVKPASRRSNSVPNRA